MYSIQLGRTLRQIIYIFYQLGIWQRDEESNFRKIGKKIFYNIFGVLSPMFLATNVVLCYDRNEAIYSAQSTIMASVLYVKLLYLLHKAQEIRQFLNDPIVVHSIENREEYEQTNKSIEKFNGYVRSYFWMLFATAILLIVIKLPIFSTDGGLPGFISFSWNDSEIIYWVAYFLMTLSLLMYIVSNFLTVLIGYIMLNFAIEYKLLGNKMKNLGVTTVTSAKEQNEKYNKIRKKASIQNSFNSVTGSIAFQKNLITLVKAHRNVTETIERFRSCFSTLFLVQITTSGIVICVAVYNLSYVSKENIFQIELFLTCLLYGLVEIFLIMYLANEITCASDCLSYCLFESNWIEQAESCKKIVVIMGEVLKQPQQLVILIYPMNLETFVRVVNGAYSMFNILKNFWWN